MMMAGTDGREYLEKRFKEMHRQVYQLKGLVEANEQKVQKLDSQMALIAKTKDLAEAAEKQQPKLDKDVEELERILARLEALAANENSRNNATPEARAINQQIESVIQDVQRLERKLVQTRLDCNLLEHEIENTYSEFDAAKKDASTRLDAFYGQIKSLRKKISDTRKAKLERFLESQDKLARAEIENQELSTRAMLFKQLVASVELELSCLDKPDGADILERETAKIDAAIREIPVHREPIAQDRQRAEEACRKLLIDVHGLEDEIQNSIEQMSQAENNQDEKARELQECNDENASLRTLLDTNEAILADLEKTRDRLKMEQTTDAADEIRKLVTAKEQMQKRIDEAKKRLEDFIGDANHCPNSMVRIVAKMQEETANVKRQIETLRREMDSQKAALRNSGINWSATTE